MSYLTTVPEFVAAAATDLASIESAIGAASSSVAEATTAVLPAGADEISAAIASLFGAHGQAFQQLSAQASRFHEQFVQALRAGANAYAGAETANVARLLAAAASPLLAIEQSQIAFNTNLVAGELAFNRALVANEIALERAFFGTDSALNGVLNRGFNAGNLLIGTGQRAANLFFGAPTPPNFTSSLLLGSGAQPFNGGQIGGLAGAFYQSLMIPGNVLGLGPSIPTPPVVANPFRLLEQTQSAFNNNLVANQMTFNQALVANEIALERQIFGTDSALNGVINRTFNAGNLLIGTGQQAVNLFFGAPVPENFTSTLLLGTGTQSFNGGQIGGVVGAFDQGLTAGANLIGLFTEPFSA